MEGKNGSDNAIGNLNDTPVWFRVALAVAMLGGAGSGYSIVTQDTTDRYYRTEALLDLKLRDERLARIQSDLSRLEVKVEKIDRRDPTPTVRDRLAEINTRLRKLEDHNLRDDNH